MKMRSIAVIIATGFICSVSLISAISPVSGAERDEKTPRLIVQEAHASINGQHTDSTFIYRGRMFRATLENAGTAVANDIRISIWPVFSDAVRIKLIPKEHYTKSVDEESGELYLTIPVLGKGESIQIVFFDESLPPVMKRTFAKKPRFPKFFWFHASCMQGSSVTDTIYTSWGESEDMPAQE